MKRVESDATGENPVGGVSAGDIRIFEVAYVVVADQIEARRLLALEESVSLEVKCRVPVVMLDDLPGAEGACEVGIFGNRGEQGCSPLLPGERGDGVAFGEQADGGRRPRSTQIASDQEDVCGNGSLHRPQIEQPGGDVDGGGNHDVVGCEAAAVAGLDRVVVRAGRDPRHRVEQQSIFEAFRQNVETEREFEDGDDKVQNAYEQGDSSWVRLLQRS